jgi:myosin heavy subunit
MDDVEEYAATRRAMAHVGLSNKAIDTVFKLVAAILHLGAVDANPNRTVAHC